MAILSETRTSEMLGDKTLKTPHDQIAAHLCVLLTPYMHFHAFECTGIAIGGWDKVHLNVRAQAR